MLGHLSPREREDLRRAWAQGSAWARVIRDAFLDGTRLRIGLARARGIGEIAAATGLAPDAVPAAAGEAARWLHARGLHLMDFQPQEPGADRHYLLAVG